MKLIDNKKYISYNNIVDNMIHWKEKNIWKSNAKIWCRKDMYIHRLINSNFLIHNIYNEVYEHIINDKIFNM